jgi:hypothetical protein
MMQVSTFRAHSPLHSLTTAVRGDYGNLYPRPLTVATNLAPRGDSRRYYVSMILKREKGGRERAEKGLVSVGRRGEAENEKIEMK